MKTAMQQHLEWLKARMTVTPQMEQELLDQEKMQLCKMYIQGRKDNHLDYYPIKHANETYNEFFKQD